MSAVTTEVNSSRGRVGGSHRWGPGSLLLALAVVAHPAAMTAQADTALSAAPPPTVIHWAQGVMVLGGLSALMLLDHPTQDYVQDVRSRGSNDVAGTVRHFGQPEVYGTVTLGLLGAGIISGSPKVARTGARLAATLMLAGVSVVAFKEVAGRPRPFESFDIDGYQPFSGQDAMPSGHTTMAFAFATSLADDLHRTWASVGLYTMAAGVGWSRMNDNKHWLTDVAAGAVLGITSAKLVNGHWRIFNLRPPSILLEPERAGLAWQASF